MKALVLANGLLGSPPPEPSRLGTFDMVIAADGGARHARVLGVGLDLLIGDLDSIDADSVDALAASGVAVRRFEVDKDETDLELALLEARRRGAREVDVLGAFGARWDHTLANVMLALSPALAGMSMRFLDGGQCLRVLEGPASLELDGAPGSTVSLIPLLGPAGGISTRGLAFPLEGETLPLGTPRGVSNVVQERPARVSLETGVLCVVETA